MARGWESKSVEMQIEDAGGSEKDGAATVRSEEDIMFRSRREGFLLQRSRILQEIAAARNARYRKLLEETLNHLELELQGLLKGRITNPKL